MSDIVERLRTSSSVGARLCFLAYPRIADRTNDLASVSNVTAPLGCC